MGVTPLNLSPELQAWHLAGLDAILLPEGADALHMGALFRNVNAGRGTPPAAHPGPPATASGQQTPAYRAPAPGQPSRDASATESQPSATTGHPARPARPASAPVRENRQAADHAGPPPGASVNAVNVVPVEQWPPVWAAQLGKTQPAPVLWTYPDLGLDLTGRGSAQRSTLLKHLIGQLHLPRGTSAFWPLSIPETAAEPALEEALFVSGMKQLRSKVIICFGPESLRQTPYRALRVPAFQEDVADGRIIMVLPDINTMDAGQPAFRTAVQFLRSALLRLNIITVDGN